MDSSWEEEKKNTETDVEKISGKRTERYWLDLEPDPVMGRIEPHWDALMCHLSTKWIKQIELRREGEDLNP